MDLNKLSPKELMAAMNGGVTHWGEYGNATEHIRYKIVRPKNVGRKLKCGNGCKNAKTHLGMANGVCLMSGCELCVARWVKSGY